MRAPAPAAPLPAIRDRAVILNLFATVIRREVVMLADPSNWRHEYRNGAEEYQRIILGARVAYREIRDNPRANPEAVLTAFRDNVVRTGICYNHVSRLIEKINGTYVPWCG